MRAVLAVAGLLLGVPDLAGQMLSHADMAAAIEQGRAGKTLQKKCGASAANGFEIVIEGPVGRIMRAAREAKRNDQPFTLADVTSEMDGAFLSVTARRDHALRDPSQNGEGNGGGRSTFRADIVVRGRAPGGEPLVLKPVGTIAHSRSNDGSFSAVAYVKQADGTVRTAAPRMGAIPGGDMAAAFDLAAFLALRADGLEIVVFATDAGEQRCKISEKDRRDLR